METIKSLKIKEDGAFSKEYQLGLDEVVISTEQPQDTSKLWINPEESGSDTPLASVAYSGNYEDLNNKPENVSDFTNDAGYLTEFTESDPTVPSYVKSIKDTDITKWNNKSDFSGRYSDLNGKPTKLSEFENDDNFIDNTVSNLVNYYTKTDSYNKSEIDGMIKNITTIDIKVVEQLPSSEISSHTIYLIPKGTPVAAAAAYELEGPDFEGSMKQDKLIIGPNTVVEGAQSDAPMAVAAANNSYDEYIYVSEKWEMIGSTEVDLTNYLTKTEAEKTYAKQTDLDSHKKDEQAHLTGTEKTMLGKTLLAVGFGDLLGVSSSESLVTWLSNYCGISEDDVLNALYNYTPGKHAIMVVGYTSTPASLYLVEEYAPEPEMDSEPQLLGTYLHLTGFSTSNTSDEIYYLDSKKEIDPSNWYIDINELMMSSDSHQLATMDDINAYTNVPTSVLRVAQADSEEDALAKSAENPNVLFYWV